ncbi:MAG TPA: PilN domain-containing protein [Bryobacteraceae bacterium]|nr:PilN domain-containing protein [Bryobacteraceae bacterium]
MKIPINLAREPFRRDRPALIASAFAGALMVVSLGTLVTIAVSERTAARQARAELETIQRQRARIRVEQTKLDAQMRRPENAIVLDRNIMINDMIRRKSISWTRIFSDLEKVLPANVRITAIHPQVNSRDELSLDMTVESESSGSVLAFIATVEKSDIFGSTEVPTWTPPTQNDPYYHYRISVNYAQKL